MASELPANPLRVNGGRKVSEEEGMNMQLVSQDLVHGRKQRVAFRNLALVIEISLNFLTAMFPLLLCTRWWM